MGDMVWQVGIFFSFNSPWMFILGDSTCKELCHPCCNRAKGCAGYEAEVPGMAMSTVYVQPALLAYENVQ